MSSIPGLGPHPSTSYTTPDSDSQPEEIRKYNQVANHDVDAREFIHETEPGPLTETVSHQGYATRREFIEDNEDEIHEVIGFRYPQRFDGV